MSQKQNPPVFLQQANYRQRRVRDGAKLLPFVGVVLLAIPLAWSSDGPEGKIGSSGLIYIFGVWVLLIVLTAILSRSIRSDASLDAKDPSDT